MSRAKGRTRQGKHKIQYKRKNQNGAVKDDRPSSPPLQRRNPKSKTSSKHAIVQARKAKCQTQVQAGVVVKPLSVVKNNKTKVMERHDNLTPFKLALDNDKNVTATTPPVVGSPSNNNNNGNNNGNNKKPTGFLTRLAAFSPMRLMTLKKAPRRQVLTRPSTLPPIVVVPPPTPHTTIPPPARASTIVKLWHNNNNNQTTQNPFYTPQKPTLLPLAATPHNATAASFSFMPNVMTNTTTIRGIVQTWTPHTTTTCRRRRRRRRSSSSSSSSIATTPLKVRFAQWNLFANNNSNNQNDKDTSTAADDNNKTPPPTPTSKTLGRPF